ncbi:S16 family serine protease [Cellulomonas sp. NTE-D12]|uniref:YlbL family protein n=1 Tax=Cellulomonas sp. NTE-D12 TaxID=2962632 RepID=UPI0030818B73|nr:hypothetical protein CELD12_25620 [Cellulomonas sp. NTE-D12]
MFASPEPRPDEIAPAPDEGAAAAAVEPRRPVDPRSVLLSGGMLLTAVLIAVAVVIPVPYAVTSPGPTRDVLGSQNGTPLIRISGAQTYPSTGQLRLTTVSGTGGPGYPSSLAGVLRGWFDPTSVVDPAEAVVPKGQTQQQIDAANSQEMTSSQENATVAALTQLGYTVPATLTVAGTQDGTDAATKLHKGDVLEQLDGTTLPDYQTLVRKLEAVTPGSTVTLTVRRDGADQQVPIVTSKRPDGRALIGVMIDPTFTFPVKVDISIDGIGGPSAGTMFALGIVDKLTPADEANGAKIAGTGTMDVTGEVGPIGGIQQKLVGARRDGADWFLAPASNCDEVVGHVPAGLHVVKVATLSDAVAAMTAIGKGAGGSLPTCTR